MDLCSFRSAVRDRNTNANVFYTGFRILDKYIEVAALVEHSCIEQLEFGLIFAAPAIFSCELGIRILGLRIFVEVLHVGVGRRGIEVEVIFLYVFTMIALVAGDAEKPLLKNRIAPIPKSQRKTESLVPVRDSGNSVFIPTIGARAGMIVRKIIPGLPPWTVIFADGAPRPLAEIWSPALPVRDAISRFLQPLFFRRHEYLRSTSLRCIR